MRETRLYGSEGGESLPYPYPIEPGTMVVDDRGYNDYSLFGKWTDQGVSFVTRMKNNTRYEVVKEQEILKNGHILKDEIIRLIEILPVPYEPRQLSFNFT